MATKRCAYKNCNSFMNQKIPCAETFYAFPKDPERCKTWLKLGGVDIEAPIPSTKRYFCSKHFDESKYVAHNQRRKQLLSAAIPWPYKEPTQMYQGEIKPDIDYVVSTMEEDEEDVVHIVDDSTMERFEEETVSTQIRETIDDQLRSFQYDDEPEFTIAIETDTEKKTLKRKLDTSTKELSSVPVSVLEDLHPEHSDNICISNCVTLSVVADEEHDDKESKLEDDLEESVIPMSANVITFIFKGQEYVQMPREMYCKEKLELIQKIKAYEEVLKNVKQLIDGVKF